MTRDLPTFYPPRPKPLLTRLIQSICYPVVHRVYRFDLQVSDEDVARLRALEGARLVYLCNHPTMEDGVAMFVFSARVGQLFNYIVAWEAFKGLRGKFLQAIGCYSIRRGLGDRASIAQTLNLLKAPRCRLVFFPEGGCSYQNDTVMPFRPGAIQMPLQAMSQMARQAEALADAPDLYLVPLSLKYRYTQPMTLVIERTLKDLEQALQLQPQQPEFYGRLIAIAHCILTRLEIEYQLPAPPDLDWNQRIERLRQHVIAWCETQLGLDPSPQVPIRERVYKIQSLLEAEDAPTAEREALYWTTVRLLNFDAVYSGYVAENPTPERFLDTLMRLEREVYQTEHIKPKAHRQAIFRVGDVVNLKAYLAAYQTDKSSTVEQLTQQLQATVQANLAVK